NAWRVSWRSESPFTVGFRAYVGFWFHCSPNPYMNRFQIAPEEWALEALFGESFVRYRARVRRWI
ncbi:hypothetical protein ACQKC8_22865, partial [Stutzerimonas stutzeri]